MRKERDGPFRQPFGGGALDFCIVHLRGGGGVEWVVVRTHAALFLQDILLVQFRPQRTIHGHAFGGHGRQELLHGHCYLLDVQDKRRPPEGVLPFLAVKRAVQHERMILQGVDQILAVPAAQRQVPGVHPLQFAQTDQRLNFRHAVVAADAVVDIEAALLFFDHVQAIAGVEAIVAHGEAGLVDFRIVGDDRTAFAASGQMLRMAEVETAHVTDRAGLFAVVSPPKHSVQSSSTRKPCFRAMAMIAPMSPTMPYIWPTTIAFVRSVIFSSMTFGSRVWEQSTSENTGRAPSCKIAKTGGK